MKDKQKPALHHYDIKVEALVPGTLIYRIIAENEEEALKQMDKKAPINFRPNFAKKRSIKATIYKTGSSIIQFVKHFGR